MEKSDRNKHFQKKQATKAMEAQIKSQQKQSQQELIQSIRLFSVKKLIQFIEQKLPKLSDRPKMIAEKQLTKRLALLSNQYQIQTRYKIRQLFANQGINLSEDIIDKYMKLDCAKTTGDVKVHIKRLWMFEGNKELEEYKWSHGDVEMLVVIFNNNNDKKRNVVVTQPRKFEEGKIKGVEVVKYLEYLEDYRRRADKLERQTK